MAVTLTPRPATVDDDQTGTTGTPVDAAWCDDLFDAIDVALAALSAGTTWVPAISFGGGTTGITYASQTGYYTKSDKDVTVHFRIVLTSKGSSTGSLLITGLPFSCHGSHRGVGSVLVDNVASAGDAMRIYADPGSTTILVRIQTATVNSAANDTHVTNTSVFSGTVTYVTP